MGHFLRRWAAIFQPHPDVSAQAVILRYHRIADVAPDPFGLCVSPERFSEHLRLIRQNAVPMQLRELVRLIQERRPIPRRVVVVTFDDGYADNLVMAKPLLERFEIPATIYVTTAYTESQREFWSDELERLFLSAGRLPGTLRLEHSGLNVHAELGTVAHYTREEFSRNRAWTVRDLHNPTARHDLFRILHDALKRFHHEQRLAVINRLHEWAEQAPVLRDSHRPLSSAELVRLAEGGLVEIGAHSVTHPVLSSLSISLQRQEIAQSKVYLEELLGCPVNNFAYPYGHPNDFTQETVEIVGETGFDSACSTVSGGVNRQADLFRLPRTYVGNWDMETFRRHSLETLLA